MGILAQQSWFTYQRKGDQSDQSRRLRKNVNVAPLELRAFLSKTTITLNELLALQPGDLITTGHPVDQDVWIEIEGRRKFCGHLGQFRGGKSVRVTEIVEDLDEAKPAGAAA
jgi:flagellar motor switch protein FliM